MYGRTHSNPKGRALRYSWTDPPTWGVAFNLNPAVDADLQAEMPLETDRSVIPAEAGIHLRLVPA